MKAIEVVLISKAEDDLKWLRRNLGLSETDAVNRALQHYRFFEEARKSGKKILLEDKKGDHWEVEHI